MSNNKEKLAHAEALTRSAEALSASINITLFLHMLGRFPDMSAVNLVLLLEQYPRTTFLARGNYWKKIYDNEPILRPEWEGKGIDLVLPAFDGSHLNPHPVLYYADGMTFKGVLNRDPPAPPDLYDLRDELERSLLQVGQDVDYRDDPVLENELLETPDDDDLNAASARTDQLTQLYYGAEEDPNWVQTLMPALATIAYMNGRIGKAPHLSLDGQEQADMAAEDHPLDFLDQVQRLYHAFLSWTEHEER